MSQRHSQMLKYLSVRFSPHLLSRTTISIRIRRTSNHQCWESDCKTTTTRSFSTRTVHATQSTQLSSSRPSKEGQWWVESTRGKSMLHETVSPRDPSAETFPTCSTTSRLLTQWQSKGRFRICKVSEVRR